MSKIIAFPLKTAKLRADAHSAEKILQDAVAAAKKFRARSYEPMPAWIVRDRRLNAMAMALQDSGWKVARPDGLLRFFQPSGPQTEPVSLITAYEIQKGIEARSEFI